MAETGIEAKKEAQKALFEAVTAVTGTVLADDRLTPMQIASTLADLANTYRLAAGTGVA